MITLFYPPKVLLFFLTSIIIIFFHNLSFAQLLAFPGAEGYGKYSVGGRGGKIYKIVNLNDSGPGSLREAVRSKGARIIIFSISGNIQLESPLKIENDSITIAGQTAPGEGICIQNYPFIVSANHIIIRYLRFRMGDLGKYQDDALNGINGNNNIIIDHCSVSWGIDEVMTFWNVENITVQWCIISESLNSSIHQKGNHGYGGIWGGTNASYHHNLIAHHTSRTPRFSGGSTKVSENVDFRNNLIYNWGYNNVYGGEKGKINIVNNYFKPGPATRKKVQNQIAEIWGTEGTWFIDGNFIEGDPGVSADNWNNGVHLKDGTAALRNLRPLFEMSIKTETPTEAYQSILKNSGAVLPERDQVDKRIVREVETGTATFCGRGYSKEQHICYYTITGIIDSQKDVGGWPELKSLPAPVDSDNDGMPDAWEIKNSLDPSDSTDGYSNSKSGYTYLEEYINNITVRDITLLSD